MRMDAIKAYAMIMIPLFIIFGITISPPWSICVTMLMAIIVMYSIWSII